MGFPKALLEFGGETFLDRLIHRLGAECAQVIVVLGAEADRIQAGLRAADRAVIVRNPDYRLGQITSMQCGLRAVPVDARGVMFTLVDHPNPAPDTVAALAAHAAPIAIPRHAGRRGHPIFLSSRLIPEFLALDATQSARTVLERHAGEVAYLEVDDPGILDDVDDREAYRRLQESAGIVR